VIHDRDASTELIGFLHVVGSEKDGLPFGIELTEKVPECEATLWVEAGCRFIEE
jgi:hypothetical protein